MSKRIGWIGLGRMGEAMVKHLTRAGHQVEVWNRTRSKAEPLVEYGAVLVSSKLDLAACDTVFTMVSTTSDLKEVLFGEGGLMTGARKPTRTSPTWPPSRARPCGSVRVSWHGSGRSRTTPCSV